jgi:hypothetical protein
MLALPAKSSSGSILTNYGLFHLFTEMGDHGKIVSGMIEPRG